MNSDNNHKIEKNNSVCNKTSSKHNSKLMEPILHLHSVPELTAPHQEKMELTSDSPVRNENIESKQPTTKTRMEGGGAKRGPLQRRRRAAFYGAARRGHDPPPGSLRPSVLNSEQDG
ncbi:hypothetical protein QXB14_004414 [Salmonella enterica]|nr:hypothetical protein [Salmonella enterica]